MAQITVPGSTAESTNVTPVSAEVPTGVTLPEPASRQKITQSPETK